MLRNSFLNFSKTLIPNLRVTFLKTDYLEKRTQQKAFHEFEVILIVTKKPNIVSKNDNSDERQELEAFAFISSKIDE